MTFTDRLIIVACVCVALMWIVAGCGHAQLVAYRIDAIEAAPVPAGGNVVTWRRVFGPGPERFERTLPDEAFFARPDLWRVGHTEWKFTDTRWWSSPMNRRLTEHDARQLARKCGVNIDGQLVGKDDPKPAKGNKYHASRTYSPVTGRTHASAFEARWAGNLVLRQRAGEISGLKFQVRVRLPGGMVMVPDARYVEDGKVIHHEAKGFETAAWRAQRNLWSVIGPTEYRVSRQRGPDEIIRPAMPDTLLLAAMRQLSVYGLGCPLGAVIKDLEAREELKR